MIKAGFKPLLAGSRRAIEFDMLISRAFLNNISIDKCLPLATRFNYYTYPRDYAMKMLLRP